MRGQLGERLGEADHPGPEMETRPRMVDRVDVRGSGATADAGADGPGGRLPWDRATRYTFPLPRFAPSALRDSTYTPAAQEARNSSPLERLQ